MNRLKQAWRELNSELPPEKTRHRDDHVLIIDGLNTFIRVFSAVPALNDDGQHVGGVLGFLKSIGSNIRQFQATRCVVVFDGSGGSQRRRKLYPDYKGNRKNKTRMNRFDEFKDLVDEAQSMKTQFKRIIQYFDVLPVTLISIDNIEADDVIAYITKQYYANTDNKVTIVSTDRDFLQLVNDSVNVWSPIKKKLYTPKSLQDEYGLIPENYLLYRMVSGDASDNIEGVKGLGLKTICKQFPDINSRELTFNDIIDEAQRKINEGSKLKIFKQLIESNDILYRNYRLMQLSDVDIAASNKIKICDIMDAEINKLDRYKFKQYFTEDKLYSNIKDVNTWLRDTFNKLLIYAGK
jgi:DNA polymerase I